MDLLQKEEKNFVEPLVGLSKIGKGVLEIEVMVPGERS
jgi:hypothetical protein